MFNLFGGLVLFGLSSNRFLSMPPTIQTLNLTSHQSRFPDDFNGKMADNHRQPPNIYMIFPYPLVNVYITTGNHHY